MSEGWSCWPNDDFHCLFPPPSYWNELEHVPSLFLMRKDGTDCLSVSVDHQRLNSTVGRILDLTK